jgi:hypothetical protein
MIVISLEENLLACGYGVKNAIRGAGGRCVTCFAGIRNQRKPGRPAAQISHGFLTD